MERENQRIMLTKRLIRDALLRLLRQKSLDKISITELCREADINRATFYRHYEVPRDVLIEMEKEMAQHFVCTHALPRTQMEARKYIYEMAAYLEEHAPLLRVMMYSHSDEDVCVLLNQLFEASIRELCTEEEKLQQMSAEEIQMLAWYNAGGGYFLLRRWMMGDIKKTAEQMAELICDLLFTIDWSAIGERFGLGTER